MSTHSQKKHLYSADLNPIEHLWDILNDRYKF
uniref:Uncharacterized protein n=1 Tax=Gouania willdenowi TaxID=441366 RepID=A0A8C5DFH0_GOUWI